LSPPTISVVAALPAGGNISSLAQLVDQALAGRDYELVVVCRGDPAETGSGHNTPSANRPIKLVTRDGGTASGMRAGLNQATGDILGVVAEGWAPALKGMPLLLAALEKGADIAVASGCAAGSSSHNRRRSGAAMRRGLTMLSRLLLPSVKKVRDPLSGFFVARREVIASANPDRAGDWVLLSTLAGTGDWQVAEVPFPIQETEAAASCGLSGHLGLVGRLLVLATGEREIRRFVQFALVGGTGIGANMGTFWAMTRVADLPDLAALVIGYIAATLWNFVLNDLWTFRDRRVGEAGATLVRCLKFSLVSGGAITIYYAIYTPLTRYLDLYDLAALAIAIGVGLVWNFGMNVMWTWRKTTSPRLSGH